MKKFLLKIKFAAVLIWGLFAIPLSMTGLFSKKHLHGTKLKKLPDDKLFEAVYFQNLDLVESFADEDIALSQISPARRTVYILSMFDMEIQNGGLRQFFVNSSRFLAPYVDECLEDVGAKAHRQLLDEFISNNKIDLHNLDSFRISNIEEYTAQTESYNFDAFDNSYCELTALPEYIVAYIKANISEF